MTIRRNGSTISPPLLRALLTLPLLAVACAPPPVPTRPLLRPLPAPTPTLSAAAPPPDPRVGRVTAVRIPLHFELDGDLAEWGSLLPPVGPPPGAPRPKHAWVADEPALPPGPNPRDAASHLAIAVSSHGALIAADLGGAARGGIWLSEGPLRAFEERPRASHRVARAPVLAGELDGPSGVVMPASVWLVAAVTG
jgi:hypothetical protein